jgi:transcription termination factor NusG
VNRFMQPRDSTSSFPAQHCASWYSIQTRSRHEKAVSKQLQVREATTCFPLVTEIHPWSGRRKVGELIAPLLKETARTTGCG